MVLIVAYDLHNPGRDYDKIAKVLKDAASWAHPQGSVWFLDTAETPATWRDRLQKAGDINDEYFVARLRQSWAGYGLGTKIADWLKSRARTW